ENGKRPHPFSSRLGRNEFRHRRVTNHEFGAESQTHNAAKKNQRQHRRRKSGGNGGKAKNDEVRLVGKAASIAIAKKTGDERSKHHSYKSQRNKLGVLREGGETCFEGRPKNGGGHVHIEAVEKHADADEHQDTPVKRRQRQTIKACAGVYCQEQLISACGAWLGCLESVLRWRARNSGRRNAAAPREKTPCTGAPPLHRDAKCVPPAHLLRQPTLEARRFER